MTNLARQAGPQARRKFTDAELRTHLSDGLSIARIAERLGVSRQAVQQRAKRLGMATIAAALVPHESERYVGETLDAWTQLNKSLERVNLLMDACDTWLRAADDPHRYDVGPREGEVEITYEVEKSSEDGKRLWTEKRKKPLSEILADLETVDGERVCAVKRWESKHADPRELILRTAQEARQTVQTAATLARMLSDARAMEVFREALLSEVSKASPEIARNVAEVVRRSIVFQQALGGSIPLSPNGGHGE